MIKKIFQILMVVVLLAYMIFAVAFVNPKANDDNVCAGMHIETPANHGVSYLNDKQIETIIMKANLNPTGKTLSQIKTDRIENLLEQNPLIRAAKVYKTIDCQLKITVYQRLPILRVITSDNNYYLDEEGVIMPAPPQFAVHVPIATGHISKEYAQTQLYDFAQFLRKNKDWEKQIDQIYILPNRDVELIPHKGSHIILLGKMDNYAEKLNKLALFYDKALDKIGWNRYSVISLKYNNQVVCTKK